MREVARVAVLGDVAVARGEGSARAADDDGARPRVSLGIRNRLEELANAAGREGVVVLRPVEREATHSADCLDRQGGEVRHHSWIDCRLEAGLHDLAALVAREHIHHANPARHLVIGQVLEKECAQVVHGCVVSEHHPGGDVLAQHRVGDARHGCLGHARVFEQGRLHFAGHHVVAAPNNDLLLRPTIQRCPSASR